MRYFCRFHLLIRSVHIPQKMPLTGRFIITEIGGNKEFKSFMLGHNLSIGSVFSINYSPRYAQLISITIRQKILTIRKEDFEKIEWVQIA